MSWESFPQSSGPKEHGIFSPSTKAESTKHVFPKVSYQLRSVEDIDSQGCLLLAEEVGSGAAWLLSIVWLFLAQGGNKICKHVLLAFSPSQSLDMRNE